MTSPIINLPRPAFEVVKLVDGLKWQGGSKWVYQEKFDGVWFPLQFEVAGSPFAVVGELVKTQVGSIYHPFDLLTCAGQDIRKLPLRERLQAIASSWSEIALGAAAFNFKIATVNQSTEGGAFLQRILTAGGEGVVAKHLDSPYGATWYKCKRSETFDLIVAEKDASGKASIRLASAQGENFGWCPTRAAFDSLRIGDIVEIEAYGRTAKGLLREPRFIRVRKDKMI